MTNGTYTTVYTSRYYIEKAYMDEEAVYFATADYKKNTDASSDSYSYVCQVEIDSYILRREQKNSRALIHLM